MRLFLLVVMMFCFQVTKSVAAELSGTLKQVEETGEINLGYRTSEPPMSFESTSGKAVGYSIDLCGHIVAAVKLELGRSDIVVNYIPVTAETRFEDIKSGKVDILCGATTKTLKRSEQVSFTQLTFATGASLLSMKTTRVSDVTELKGKRVAVVSNTTTLDALNSVIGERLIDAEVVQVSSAEEGMSLLEQGEVSAFSSDQVVLIGQVVFRGNEERYYLAEEIFSFEPFALAIRRGDVDFKLVADRALSQLNRSGQILSVYQKWFGRISPEPLMILKAPLSTKRDPRVVELGQSF